MNILKTLLATAALLPVLASAQTLRHDPYHGNVNDRQHEQAKRIRQGVRSGALTHREARGLRNRESVIRSQERRDRFFHGGHLTHNERVRLNHEQNHVSHGIYDKKHNWAHRPS